MIQKTILFILVSLFAFQAAMAEPIQLAENLFQDASVAQNEGKPIVFFVTADHCPYCEQLREEYFQFSPSDKRFILRELELDAHHDATDFNGDKTNHRKLANRYNISLTPTVVFAGPDGTELTDSIIGVLTMDFYNYYFERALKVAISQIKGTKLTNQP